MYTEFWICLVHFCKGWWFVAKHTARFSLLNILHYIHYFKSCLRLQSLLQKKKILLDSVSGIFNGLGLRAVTQGEERFAHAYVMLTPSRLSMQWGRTLRFTPVDFFLLYFFHFDFFCSILFLSMYSSCKELWLSGSPSKHLRIGDQQIYG